MSAEAAAVETQRSCWSRCSDIAECKCARAREGLEVCKTAAVLLESRGEGQGGHPGGGGGGVAQCK